MCSTVDSILDSTVASYIATRPYIAAKKATEMFNRRIDGLGQDEEAKLKEPELSIQQREWKSA